MMKTKTKRYIKRKAYNAMLFVLATAMWVGMWFAMFSVGLEASF